MNLNTNDDLSFLNCIICYRKAKRPRMCPYCSKLICYDCLSSWDSKQNQCPNCRTFLGFGDYTNCERFVDEIRQQFTNKQQVCQPKDMCVQHNLKMRYYCYDCTATFCPDCSAFSDTHKGHNIKRIAQIYKIKKQRIDKEILRFDARIQDCKAKSMSVKMEMQKLAQSKNIRKVQIEAHILKMLTQLEYQFEDKQCVIISRYQSNQEEIQLLENIKDTILNDMEEHSQNQVIEKTEEVLHLIQSLSERHVEQLEIDTNFKTIQQLVPEYHMFSFTLKKFSTLNQSIIYSHSQYFNGCEWRLKVYPKGNGIAKNKSISVFLEMSRGISSKIKYEYKIELVNHLSHFDSMMREYFSDFEIGECWGYNQFIDLKTLELGFLADDELQFRFYIRNPTYKDMVTEQKKYIAVLNEKHKELQKTLLNKSLEQPIKQNRIRDIILQMSSKRQQVRNQLISHSIQNQAPGFSMNRMKQKDQFIDQ